MRGSGMKTIIVVEMERDKVVLEASGVTEGVDRVMADGREMSVVLAQSFAMTEDRRVLYIVETASEEDRFFVRWMRNSYEFVGATRSPMRILPAAPALSSAVRDAKWRGRLRRWMFPVVVDVGLVNGINGVQVIDAIKAIKQIGNIPLVEAKHGVERVLECGIARFELSPGSQIVELEAILQTSGFRVCE
jgi:hypothetical protein